jgi:uncharacterized membrane protein YhaH (DUF805 family)
MQAINRAFGGRIDITDYFLLNLILLIPTILIGLKVRGQDNISWSDIAVFAVCFLVLLITVGNRLRDIKISGKWTMLMLIPGINILLWLILFFIPTRHTNWQVPEPKAQEPEKPEEPPTWH